MISRILMQEESLSLKLACQEKKRNIYWEKYDPFIDTRLFWRASTIRHLFHILPGESILEVGAGDGRFSHALAKATKGECKITAAVFSPEYLELARQKTVDLSCIDVRLIDSFPAALGEKRFDYVVAYNMLDDKIFDLFICKVKDIIAPSGGILLFQPNSWNPYYRLRRIIRRLLPIKWRRPSEDFLLNRFQIFTLLSEVGYTHINVLPYDFLYSPIPGFLLWPAKNISLILENCPFIRNFAGSMYICARKEPVDSCKGRKRDLCEHSMFLGKVSFIIPCRNEEMNIPVIVDGIKCFYDRYIREIIIVDDNSTDDTSRIAKQMAEKDGRIRVIRRSLPNGVGLALSDGIAAAEGDYILLMDADFKDIIPELRDLFDAVASGADVAIGSRFSRESVLLNYPFTKIIANRAFHAFANIVLFRHFRDISNNLKLLKREIAKQINIEFPDFAANAETGLKPLLAGYDVREVAVSWINRSVNMGLSSFKLGKIWPNYCRLLFRLATRQLKKKINAAITIAGDNHR